MPFLVPPAKEYFVNLFILLQMTKRLQEIHEQMSKAESEMRDSHRKQVFVIMFFKGTFKYFSFILFISPHTNVITLEDRQFAVCSIHYKLEQSM